MKNRDHSVRAKQTWYNDDFDHIVFESCVQRYVIRMPQNPYISVSVKNMVLVHGLIGLDGNQFKNQAMHNKVQLHNLNKWLVIMNILDMPWKVKHGFSNIIIWRMEHFDSQAYGWQTIYRWGLTTPLTEQLQLQRPAIYKNSISKMFREFEALAISKKWILLLNMTSWLGPN